MSKRLYIPLPNRRSRDVLIKTVTNKEKANNNKYDLTEKDFEEISTFTKGYSGSDLMGVIREAAMLPIRTIENILEVDFDKIRGVNLDDFKEAVRLIKPSVSEKNLTFYKDWNKDFGSFEVLEED